MDEVRRMPANGWLVTGGVLSALASVLHIAVIIGGPEWYRFFGAGEAMARAAERGSVAPAVITFMIATVLAIWALYAFSGAGLVRRLPLLKTALVLISGIYLLRAFLLIPSLMFKPELVDPFALWSSLVVLVYGGAYAVGTWQEWSNLRTI